MKTSQAQINKLIIEKTQQGQLPDKHENYSCVGSVCPIGSVEGDATIGSTGHLTGTEKSEITLATNF